MMGILTLVKTLNLPDWWVCAGFVRSKIWDVLHGFEARTPLQDVDVIYFDPVNTGEADEKILEGKLKALRPDIPWSVKNQARMHVINNLPPYSSAVDGISKFPETVTALGVKLDENDRIILAAPWGIGDVIDLLVKPTPLFSNAELKRVYDVRINKKNWKATWKLLKIT
ncbi:nucleotidyltransferase family protein [Neobacillus niacini]|uniref:nucleotidyltransferase family protein n=1 Tax=Neobacillus niacini TaxID=86668 RepID=UPI0037CC8F68